MFQIDNREKLANGVWSIANGKDNAQLIEIQKCFEYIAKYTLVTMN